MAPPYPVTPPSNSAGTQGLGLQQYAESPTSSVFRLKPLGWRLLKPEVRAVQERLVKALGELSAAKRGLSAMTESHNRVVEAGSAVLTTPHSEVARAALEAAVANAGKVSTGVKRPPHATLPLATADMGA